MPADTFRRLAHRARGGLRRLTTPPPVEDFEGWCPICEAPARFVSRHPWLRDHLHCQSCPGRSIPRERALMLAIIETRPDWRTLRIHESSPGGRGASRKLADEAPGYVATQFFPGQSPGAICEGFRNENLECSTFPDAAFDLVISQDVMEHVNRPDLVFRDVARTLAPGGAYIFTAPTYKGLATSERRAFHHPDGPEHLRRPPEYHGNPIDPVGGALVTFHYGHDLPDLIGTWSGMDVKVERRRERRHGILGEFMEVYICRRP